MADATMPSVARARTRAAMQETERLRRIFEIEEMRAALDSLSPPPPQAYPEYWFDEWRTWEANGAFKVLEEKK